MWNGERSKVYSRPILGILSVTAILYLNFGDKIHFPIILWQPKLSFIGTNSSRFVDKGNGEFFFVNGWNSYWLMEESVRASSRSKVSEMLRRGAEMGMTVCRTWAFSDGGADGSVALQIYPGVFDERVFKALDFVIFEARRYKIRLILSLVNSLNAFGGKDQYVRWAREAGVNVTSSTDSFFSHPIIKGYFKNYIKSWIAEMAAYIKSLDQKHLVTVGLEGFYGPKTIERSEVNPGQWAASLGSDFLQNSATEHIDFASVHAYPDSWIPNATLEEKANYLLHWMDSHISDGEYVLKKPVLFTEVGFSLQGKKQGLYDRNLLLKIVYDKIYESANKTQAGAGALIWQLLVEGVEQYSDEFSLVAWEHPSTYKLILEQSCRIRHMFEKGEMNRKIHHSGPCSGLSY
ncbi:mannan endo-1,4-beta-mannosidase 6-like isoform X3 [Tasmannia lanceolata]|uniref:mannan endo-1,4-beta-mannosidase 6-like isoform X3 n=1 Tax=Tasmannia lanceolata TaxID=3420 RepID=UPI004063CC6D